MNCALFIKVAEGLTVDGILESWAKIKPVIMEAWDEDKDALIDLFGKVRDDWINKDLTTWIGANRYVFNIISLLDNTSFETDLVQTIRLHTVKVPSFLSHLPSLL